MPAQISHTVCARRAVTRALGDAGTRITSELLNYLALGAQGPDMFLHNQRTEPSGFLYGKLLHNTGGYGSFVSSMAEYLLKGFSDAPVAPNAADAADAAPRKVPIVSPESAFLLGFATHAVLDRYTHPFINYFAGWVDPEREETKKYHQTHPFFERILDVYALKKYENRNIESCNFYSLVDCGAELPARVRGQLVHAVERTFGKEADRGGNASAKDIDAQVSNAYLDTMYFYNLTDPPARDNMKTAYEMDRDSGFKFRYLALFHPLRPWEFDIDFVNEAHAPWQNPCGGEAKKRRESFFDLFEAGEKEAAGVLEATAQVLEGQKAPETLKDIIGEGNLNNGSLDPCILSVSEPLPLPEIIDRIYLEFTPE